jgi:hypothetical protein
MAYLISHVLPQILLAFLPIVALHRPTSLHFRLLFSTSLYFTLSYLSHIVGFPMCYLVSPCFALSYHVVSQTYSILPGYLIRYNLLTPFLQLFCRWLHLLSLLLTHETTVGSPRSCMGCWTRWASPLRGSCACVGVRLDQMDFFRFTSSSTSGSRPVRTCPCFTPLRRWLWRLLLLLAYSPFRARLSVT